MKRLIALLTALWLIALPAIAEPMSTFDYTDDLLEDGSPIYYFQELSLRLPADWRGKVMARQEVSGVSFYQIASYEKYLENGLDGGGFLFMLGASVNSSFSELPAFAYLGFSEQSAMNYYLQLPSDYPAWMEDEDIRAEYDALSSEIDYVVANAEFYPGVSEAEPEEEPAVETAPEIEPEGDVPADLVSIDCPEMGFSTVADPAYAWDYQDGTGITIYTQEAGRIPYVIVYRSEDLIGEPYDYILEQYTPHIQKKYGDDLVSCEEVENYEIGGKTLPAGLYTYELQGYLIDMIRIYDSTGSRTAAYTAKYIQGQGEATLAALDAAVRGFQEED